VVCLAPRALRNCAPSAPWGASARPLNFTVRRPMNTTASRYFIALFLIICCGDIASAQPMDPATLDRVAKLDPGQSIVRGDAKYTLHQRDAGAKDAKGWFIVRSTEGGFSVRFPAAANDITYRAKGGDGSEFEQNFLTSEASNRRYVVTCTKPTKLFEASNATIEHGVKDIGSASRQFKSAHFSRRGLTGVEYSGIDAQGSYFAGQLFLFGSQVCMFLAGSHRPIEGIPGDVHEWFISFRPTDRGKD
jgi:hypothetical protein